MSRGGREARLAVIEVDLGADVLRWPGHPTRSVARSPQRDRSWPAAARGEVPAPAADPVRPGVVRSPRLVAASARALRRVRSASDADGRVSAASDRRRYRHRARRAPRVLLLLDPVP